MLGSFLKKAIQEQLICIGLRNFEWRLSTIQKTKKSSKLSWLRVYCFSFFVASFVLPNILLNGVQGIKFELNV